jgi:membrane protein implicated in regulation of membrane protease activity
MTNPNPEPDSRGNEKRLTGTTYDLLLILLTLAIVGLIFLDVGTALAAGEYFYVMVISVVLTILLTYLLYRFGKKRRKPTGYDFNL